MGFQNSRRLEIEAARTVTDPGTSFEILGDSLDNPAVAILFVNATDGFLWVSDDENVDKIPLVAGASFILDVRANSGHEPISLSKGKQFWVRRVGSATGDVHMTPLYMRVS